MCLLVICSHAGRLEPSLLEGFSDRLRQIVDSARVDRRPVAYVQRREGISLNGLGLHIGRYEPIFGAFDIESGLSSGLIDFITKSATTHISLAGLADWDQLERFRGLLMRAGFKTEIDPVMISPLET